MKVDHEDLIDYLASLLKPYTPDMFLPVDCEDPGMIQAVEACCEILNGGGRLIIGGQKSPPAKATFKAAAVAALELRDHRFFRMMAKALERGERDRVVVAAVIEAIEEHGRTPSFSEVMKHLPRRFGRKTLQRRLRELGVDLPQAKRYGTEPRAS